MLSAWAEQAEKYRNRDISRENYDNWRYNYTTFANLKDYIKIAPSQKLSDMLVDVFHKSENNSKENN